jgi:hypothetical protein
MGGSKRGKQSPRGGNRSGGTNQQRSHTSSPNGGLSPAAKAAKKQAVTMEIDNQVAFIEGTADKHATKPPPGILKTPPKERHGVNFDESRNIETPPNRLRVRLDKEVDRNTTVAIHGFGKVGMPAAVDLAEQGAKVVAVSDAKRYATRAALTNAICWAAPLSDASVESERIISCSAIATEREKAYSIRPLKIPKVTIVTNATTIKAYTKAGRMRIRPKKAPVKKPVTRTARKRRTNTGKRSGAIDRMRSNHDFIITITLKV